MSNRDLEEMANKQCYGSSVRKVITAAILLLILEVNMIAIYTYNMVDHSEYSDTPRKEDIVVRVKRTNMDYFNTVTESTLGNIFATVKHSLHMDGASNNDEVTGSGDGQFPDDPLISQGHVEFYEKKLNKTVKKPHHAKKGKKHHTNNASHIIPSFYIIGGRTSGTETLRKLINHHPQMVTSTATRYFTDDAKFHKGDKWYRNRLPKVPKGKKLLEVDEDMFASPIAAYRLKRKNPTAKLILVLRDPYERVLVDFLTFHKGIEGSGEQTYEGYFVNATGTAVNEGSPIIGPSMYDVHLKHWLAMFNFSRILFIDYAQMMSQPFTIMKKVERFLGVQAFYRKTSFVNYNKKSLCTRTKQPQVCLNKDYPDLSLPSDIEQLLRSFFTQHMDRFWTIVSNDLPVNELVSLVG